MKALKLVLPTLALGAATVFVAPAQTSDGFSTIHSGLNLNQRDFRVRNNFADGVSNNNNTPNPDFPGFFGAMQAVWKGAAEWGSSIRGGDPTQTLGNGNANFDFSFQGVPSGAGGLSSNIVSVLGSCSGGTLAFVQGGGNGWTMKFCDNWTWSDGPGFASGGQFDIQGVGTHEFGHSLGLGHSNVSSATMWPSTPNGNGQRSIAGDDINGLQFIYGAKSASKPEISSVSIGAGTITINGSNFDPVDNDVWFTNRNITGASLSDPRIRVTGVASVGGAGNQIVVGIPGDAGPGEVLVQVPGSAGSALSNAVAADVDGGGGNDVSITSITPSTIDRLIPGTDQTITIAGLGFDVNTDLLLDGSPVTTIWTIVNGNTITLDMPSVSLGVHTFEVDNGSSNDTSNVTVVANATPTLECGTGNVANPVFQSGFPVVRAGLPGEIHLLIGSPSGFPSDIPGLIHLDLGNQFSQSVNLGAAVIGPDGVHESSLSVVGLSGTPLFFQCLRIPVPFGFPLQESNRQWVTQVD